MMVAFKLLKEEFKVSRVFIADWIAAYAPLKLKLPLWRAANAYARVLFAWIKAVLEPEVEVCVEVPDVILVMVWAAVVTAYWIAVSFVYYESSYVPVYEARAVIPSCSLAASCVPAFIVKAWCPVIVDKISAEANLRTFMSAFFLFFFNYKSQIEARLNSMILKNVSVIICLLKRLLII